MQKIRGIFFVLLFVIFQMTGFAEGISLVPVGQTVGITLDMKGVTVVDTTDVEALDGKRSAPAKDGGIRAGDIIEEIDDSPIDSASDMERLIANCGGEEMKLIIRRGENRKECKVTPTLSADDEKYRIGVWIKDAASGIGTITYFNPETKEFGALGHGITEMPEQKVISIRNGEVLDASIVSVRKGGKGQPGELVGVFTEDDRKLGNVSANTEVGLKGTIDEPKELKTVMEPITVAERSEVKEGDAEILANVEEGKIEKFSVEIQKINKDANNPKGMVIKVTDNRLLDKTGGIVQGMSGSPIIQNGKLVGAVTHVFVNDPSRGYGIFIENMLAETKKD